MRYLIISDEYRPFRGGIARVAGELADGLTQRGNQVTVLTRKRGATADDSGETAEVVSYRMPRFGPIGKLYLAACWPFSFGRWIRRESFDRILVVDPANALPLPIMSALGHVPYEILLHGSEILRYSRKGVTRYLFRRSLADATRLFSTTRFVESELHSRYGHPSHLTSCGVGSNFLNDQIQGRDLDQLRRRYGFSDSDFVIGTVSRLDKRKGNDIVIEAVKRLAPRFQQLKYLIGGVGPDEQSLRALVDKHQLGDRVIFAGRIPEEELVMHYELMNVYVMPNRMTKETVEGFGIAFAEAASRGVPSIGVDNGGVSEAIADKVSGLLLPSADSAHVVDALTQILDGRMVFDSDSIRTHGRQFTWDRFVDRILEAPLAA